MAPQDNRRPRMDSWVAAVHKSGLDGDQPVGSGVLVDAYRVLTCAHVVFPQHGQPAQLWVAFPKADELMHRRIKVVRAVAPDPAARKVKDVALLVLEEPVAEEFAAPLRRPKPSDLVGGSWWSFGFPDDLGDSSEGRIGESISYGWVRLNSSGRRLDHGDSGAALWSAAHQAVVGIVGQARPSTDEARALSMWAIADYLPDEKLQLLTDWAVEDAGDAALSEWGWTLTEDPEAGRHWRPRARGVSTDAERGFRFRGRVAALTTIIDWITRSAGDRRQVLVVTGSPGVGKSAVLGRIVTTADQRIAATLPPEDDALRAPEGAVACAIHAKGKTALDIACEVASAASAALPSDVDELPVLVRSALGGRPPGTFAVVVDALDEAATPDDARAILRAVAIPLAETCADLGVRVVVGSRRVDGEGDLIVPFGSALEVLDLDSPAYFEQEDLVAYTLATLQLLGDERSDSPYSERRAAEAVAERIATIAQCNFLIAGLVARSHGLHDRAAVDPISISFTPTVDAALRAYLAFLPRLDGVPAGDVLTALAYAESPGLTLDLWRTAVGALTHHTPSLGSLRAFARSAAANFLIESSEGAANASAFRLFHQALNDALVSRCPAEASSADERAIAVAFQHVGSDAGWEGAPDYLLRSLPDHAARGGVIDILLKDDVYALHADLRRLVPAAKASATAAGRNRSRLLRMTPQALDATPEERTALFSVTETRERLGRGYRDSGLRAPYLAVWAAGSPHLEETVLEGHGDWISALCLLPTHGHTTLASAANDGTVRLWNLDTGDQLRVLEGSAQALCAVSVDGRLHLVTAGHDSVVRLRDPESGVVRRTLEGHTGEVRAMHTVQLPGRTLLATAGKDSTVRLWDPKSGEAVHVLKGHSSWVNTACTITIEGHLLLVTAGNDSVVRLWDPKSGELRGALEGHAGPVLAVCAVDLEDRTLLVTTGTDSTIRLWDPKSGEAAHVLEGHDGWVNAACVITTEGRPLIVTAGDDSMVRMWDPRTGAPRGKLEGHSGRVLAACAVSVAGDPLIVTAGNDSMVRVWDPGAGSVSGRLDGPTGRVTAVCTAPVKGRPLVVTAGQDTGVQWWDPESGDVQRTVENPQDRTIRSLCTLPTSDRTLLVTADAREAYLQDAGAADPLHRFTPPGGINALCALSLDGRPVLITGGDGGSVHLWEPDGVEPLHTLDNETTWISALCALSTRGRTLLAAAGERLPKDGGGHVIRLWDVEADKVRWTFEGLAKASAMCAVPLDDRTLLASVGDDRTVRLWDPQTGEAVFVHEGHTAPVMAVRAIVRNGRTLLVTAGDDRTVRFWVPFDPQAVRVIPVRSPALSIAEVDGLVVIGLSDGVMALDVTSEALSMNSIGIIKRDRGTVDSYDR
ncbi:trypsin-like peptidase domain-containing protein [Kitasatospora acidiphila]|nr:trypsin-like peptidase domain-containing protein [Kitasatospora acidiphila]